MTSHLESTASHAEERVKQLKIALKQLKAVPKDKTAVFGGDLNMRDKEVAVVNMLIHFNNFLASLTSFDFH